MSNKRKIFQSLLLLFLTACSSTSDNNFSNFNSGGNEGNVNNSENGSNQDTEIDFGMRQFLPTPNAEFQVIFFDNDSIVSKDGKNYELNFYDDKQNNNKPSDVYLIKSGNTEILVDAGTQDNKNKIRENFPKNMARKLATYISDGVLDYLIITHPDLDHIAYLIEDYGLLNMFYDYELWIQKYNENKPLTTIFDEAFNGFSQIANIIDFDTHRVRSQNPNLNTSNSRDYDLITTAHYKDYIKLRDLLENKQTNGTKYYPASLFFHEVNEEMPFLGNAYMDSTLLGTKTVNSYKDLISKNGDELVKELPHFAYGVPNRYLTRDEEFQKVHYTFSTKYLSTARGEGKVQYLSTERFLDKDNFHDYKPGKLSTHITDKNTKRYTYDIEVAPNVYLKILYNWFFDSFRSVNYVPNSSLRSGDINDLSVPLIIESKSGRFLATGDGSGDFESALLNYYKGTDVLNNISLFKAAHHGSVSNGENSLELYNTISPKIVVIPGTAQPTAAHLKDDDPLRGPVSTVTTLKQDFFDNISNKETKILINKVVSKTKESFFQNRPFYGDIKIVFKENSVSTHYTYIGEINAYMGVDNIISFNTYKNNQITYLTETEWFSAMNYSFKEGK